MVPQTGAHVGARIGPEPDVDRGIEGILETERYLPVCQPALIQIMAAQIRTAKCREYAADNFAKNEQAPASLGERKPPRWSRIPLSDFRPAMPVSLSHSHQVVVKTGSVAVCPFHDGAATLDLLLAELDPRETELFDAVLDLRSAASAAQDAAVCIEQLLRVRSLLAGRHYLAFYRVRCWARRALRVEVRVSRTSSWIACNLPFDVGNIDELVNTSLATLAADGVIPVGAHVRFAFAIASKRDSEDYHYSTRSDIAQQ